MSLLTGLISYWKLDGNSTDSVSSNNGTDTAITYNTSNGIINQGAGFNNTSSVINFGTGTNLKPSPAVSVSLWIKTSSAVSREIFLKSSNGNGGVYSYSIAVTDSTHISSRVNISATPTFSDLSATASVTNGAFHHIVMTYDTGTHKLYVDGSNVATGGSGSAPFYSGDFPCIIGADYNGGVASPFFNGDVDEAGIWGKALTQAEVTTLYNGGVGLSYPFGLMNAGFLTNMI